MVIDRHGYAGATPPEIPRVAGVSRGGFYHHFATEPVASMPGRSAHWPLSPACCRRRAGSPWTNRCAFWRWGTPSPGPCG
ncbi:TetR/AcrR family transcriptional regulator [Streptomyces sp. NPDC017524]|uniref:TetR/AcrR family transcriptional regulator n=1 Tax=unclassified Streptomyces TaxID=2593676 RepID=UPI0037ABACE3